MIPSLAGGSAATGRTSHAKHINCDDTDKKRYPGPTGWGLGHEAEAYKKVCHAAKSEIQFRIPNIINQNILSSFYMVKKFLWNSGDIGSK